MAKQYSAAQQRILNDRIADAKKLLKNSTSKPGSQARANLVRNLNERLSKPLPGER